MEQVQKDISRYEELIKSNATSEKAYDDLLFDYREFEMQKLTRQLALEKLQIQKEKSVIRSPFNGMVLAMSVEAGSRVVPGNAVLTIGSAGDLYAGVAVSEEMLQLKIIPPGTRIRPIFMSAFTSLFGMLPLVLATGSGSELYRGLGSVLLGGL
ncbi:MAG: hypothetical protein E4H46_04385, partial [Desulfobacterales bacterium]